MEKIKLFTGKEQCCGCTACYSVCTNKAISMESDYKGFLYPSIDENKCSGCGLCVKVCNFEGFKNNIPKENIDCYAAKHTNGKEVKTSRSGGFFIALAEYALANQGVVFGAEFQDVKTVIHKSETTKQGIDRFKGSKYVQSDMRDCFNECIQCLKDDKLVLFSGTACQIDGLISLLKTKKISMEKLITVDIVCHGVPSPKIWNDYVSQLEKKNNSGEIVDVNFRNKALFGWREHKESYIFSNGETVVSEAFTKVFYLHIMFREACYNCSYTTPHRNADITIADYWGIENNATEFDDNLGVNLVLVHSDKGRRVFEQIKSNINYRQTNLENSMQPNLKKPSHKGERYDAFWEDYLKLSNDKFMKKYFFGNKLRTLAKKAIKYCFSLVGYK